MAKIKFLQVIAFVLLMSCQPVFAAISATAVWTARTDATAANVNAGFFNSAGSSAGTDYSTGTLAHSSGSDLSTSNGSTNPCTVHSTHAFTSDEVRNGLVISTTGAGGHFTTGRYEVTSLSGSDAVLDRACANAASESSGTWKLGGALSLQDSTDSTVLKQMSAGNKLYIKAGTYTLTGTLNVSATAGTATAHIVYEGFNSTPGDLPLPGSGNQPIIKGGVFLFGQYYRITNLQLEHTAGDLIQNGGNNVTLVNNKIIERSTSANIAAIAPGTYWTIIGNEIISYNGYGIKHSNDIVVQNNYFHDSNIGIQNNGSGNNYSNHYVNNIFESMVTGGITWTAAETTGDIVTGNTFFGGVSNKTGYGVNFATGNADKFLMHNIFYGLATAIQAADAADANQGTPIYSNWNAFNNNTANTSNAVLGTNDITSDPGFKNVAQITGTAGSLSASTLTDNSADFSNVVNNQDFIYVISGTGATAGVYAITGHTTHTLTLGTAPGGSGSNINYQLTTGHNLMPGPNMVNKGLGLGSFPGALPSYTTLGAISKMPGSPRRVQK